MYHTTASGVRVAASVAWRVGVLLYHVALLYQAECTLMGWWVSWLGWHSLAECARVCTGLLAS